MSLDRRIDYETHGFDAAEADVDPLRQWRLWFDQAVEAECVEPNAFVLSTIGDDGIPDSRNVLARGADEQGIVFFTNYTSAKSQHLIARPVASAVFSWLAVHRQVKLRGRVERVSAAESDAYFASRPRNSQIGAWASPQSRVIADRSELEALVSSVEARFEGADIPRPEHWGGWRIAPEMVEFWQGRPSRLHDRIRYRRLSQEWVIERLAP
ncbi:MAG: pyridoxamine 5'-phosphate oxidase [Actinomycetota bacterium]